MADLEPHTAMYIAIEGTICARETSMTLTKKSNAKEVHTVVLGFAGMSAGSATCEISVENAVPTTDFEFNPDEFIRTNAVVEFAVIMAGRQTIIKGVITEAEYKHGVDTPSSLSFKATCRYGSFE